MLYLHFGLHKTATTSFQASIFPRLKGFYYAGRFVGSIEESTDIYIELGRYCFSEKIDSKEERRLTEKLKDLVSLKRHVIISDEWFTADYSGFYGFKGARWQTKLEKISRIVGSLEHKVLMTIREPLEGVYSQYCEFLSVGLDKYYSCFADYITSSNDALVYEYDQLDALLSRLFMKVNYLPFRYVADGSHEECLREHLGVQKISVTLSHENKKEKTSTGINVRRRSVLLSSLTNYIPLQVKALLKRFRITRVLNDRLAARFSRQVLVSPLTAEEKAVFGEAFKDSERFYYGLLSKPAVES